jgi:hypothetical protein
MLLVDYLPGFWLVPKEISKTIKGNDYIKIYAKVMGLAVPYNDSKNMSEMNVSSKNLSLPLQCCLIFTVLQHQ